MSFSLHAKAQVNSIVNFYATQINKIVYMSFTIKQGNTCADTQIQRSADSITFNTIGIIPGICGSITTDESYSFSDSLPLYGQINYYRIYLGNQGSSYVVKVEVSPLSELPLIVYPNPSSDFTTVQLDQSLGKNYQITVFDLFGKKMIEPARFFSPYFLSTHQWVSGNYIIQVSSEDGLILKSNLSVVR